MDAIVATNLVEIRGVRQAYHKESSADLIVLDNVDLTIKTGEIVGLLGRVRVREVDASCASSAAC